MGVKKDGNRGVGFGGAYVVRYRVRFLVVDALDLVADAEGKESDQAAAAHNRDELKPGQSQKIGFDRILVSRHRTFTFFPSWTYSSCVALLQKKKAFKHCNGRSGILIQIGADNPLRELGENVGDHLSTPMICPLAYHGPLERTESTDSSSSKAHIIKPMPSKFDRTPLEADMEPTPKEPSPKAGDEDLKNDDPPDDDRHSSLEPPADVSILEQKQEVNVKSDDESKPDDVGTSLQPAQGNGSDGNTEGSDVLMEEAQDA
ncbi:hypothetical protein M5K25_013563 [Dendrobium thyrsiflorum]|uniref:Uncharacterized protein n=1 Tax=Dendrobium thyrsiflorum TaxID=117978 RepID=A0ABD0UTK5_DENTH